MSRARSVSRSSKSKGKSRRISGGPSTKLKRVSPFEKDKRFQGRISHGRQLVSSTVMLVTLLSARRRASSRLMCNPTGINKQRKIEKSACASSNSGRIVEKVSARTRVNFARNWIISCNSRCGNHAANACRRGISEGRRTTRQDRLFATSTGKWQPPTDAQLSSRPTNSLYLINGAAAGEGGNRRSSACLRHFRW